MTNVEVHAQLARANFISSVGDFLFFFIAVAIVYHSSESVLLAAYCVPIKSAACVLGAMTFPWLISRASLRSILCYSQGISAVALLLLLVTLLLWDAAPTTIIFVVLFLQTLLKQHFQGVRETLSRMLGEAHQQRSLQSEIMGGVYGGKIWGSLAGVLLIKYLPLPVAIAAATGCFFYAAAQSRALPHHAPAYLHRFWRPLQYIWHQPALLQIFLIRGIFAWIPLGLYNYLIFSVIQEQFARAVIDTAWTHIALGIGGVAASLAMQIPASTSSSWINRIRQYTHRYTDADIAFWCTILLGLLHFALLRLPSFWLTLGVITVIGVGNGICAIATMSLRRKIASDAQFAEVHSLEVVVSKFVESLVASLCYALLAKAHLTYVQGLWICAIAFWLYAGVYRFPELRKL